MSGRMEIKGLMERSVLQYLNKLQCEEGRYHLYINYACPFCHRVLIALALKGIPSTYISQSKVRCLLRDKTEPFFHRAWEFDDAGDRADPLNNFSSIFDLYKCSEDNDEARMYDKRMTLPIMWDKTEKKIANNESTNLIEQLNVTYNDVCARGTLDLYPEDLRGEIDELNERMQNNVNLGVYRCGFAPVR